MRRLRSAASADAGAVAALHIASWQAAYPGELPDAFLGNQSLAERTADWQLRLAAPGTRLLLLEDADVLLGLAAFGPSKDTDADPRLVWELYNLHILPERRGGGLGRQLLDAAADQRHGEGRRRITLWVAERNWPARRFYERQGMRVDDAKQLHPLGRTRSSEVRYLRSLW